MRLNVFFYERQIETTGTVCLGSASFVFWTLVWNAVRNAYTYPPCFVSPSCSVILFNSHLKENMAVTVRHSVEMASLDQQASIKISSIVKQFKQLVQQLYTAKKLLYKTHQ